MSKMKTSSNFLNETKEVEEQKNKKISTNKLNVIAYT